MNETPPAQLREVLLESVPPLGDPPDRLGEVGLRVRRSRTRAVVATVASVVMVGAVAVGVPMLLRETTALPLATPSAVTFDAANCPTTWPEPGPGLPPDKPGPLVPADGALSVTLCELPTDLSGGATASPGTVPRAQDAPRTLTLRAGELVTALNRLRTREQLAEQLGQPHELGCTLIGFGENLSLVVTYADRDPMAVLLDRNCGTATADGRTRYMSGTEQSHPALLDGFLELYREQLAATTNPATVKAPACAASLSQQDVNGFTSASEPRDGIARNRGGADAYLPNALVEVTTCRYAVTGGKLQLTKQHSQRNDLEPVRDLLNNATTVRNSTDGNGTQTVTNLSECRIETPISKLDIVWIADTTGAVSEVRISRAPCPEVRRSGMGGLVPQPELIGQLDHWLA